MSYHGALLRTPLAVRPNWRPSLPAVWCCTIQGTAHCVCRHHVCCPITPYQYVHELTQALTTAIATPPCSTSTSCTLQAWSFACYITRTCLLHTKSRLLHVQPAVGTDTHFKYISQRCWQLQQSKTAVATLTVTHAVLPCTPCTASHNAPPVLPSLAAAALIPAGTAACTPPACGSQES